MIYLAQFQVRTYHYPDGPGTYEKVILLVEADTEEAAIDKIEAAYESCEPGDDSVHVEQIEISEMLR